MAIMNKAITAADMMPKAMIRAAMIRTVLIKKAGTEMVMAGMD